MKNLKALIAAALVLAPLTIAYAYGPEDDTPKSRQQTLDELLQSSKDNLNVVTQVLTSEHGVKFKVSDYLENMRDFETATAPVKIAFDAFVSKTLIDELQEDVTVYNSVVHSKDMDEAQKARLYPALYAKIKTRAESITPRFHEEIKKLYAVMNPLPNYVRPGVLVKFTTIGGKSYALQTTMDPAQAAFEYLLPLVENHCRSFMCYGLTLEAYRRYLADLRGKIDRDILIKLDDGSAPIVIPATKFDVGGAISVLSKASFPKRVTDLPISVE